MPSSSTLLPSRNQGQAAPETAIDGIITLRIARPPFPSCIIGNPATVFS